MAVNTTNLFLDLESSILFRSANIRHRPDIRVARLGICNNIEVKFVDEGNRQQKVRIAAEDAEVENLSCKLLNRYQLE
jgi:hypothetical protein